MDSDCYLLPLLVKGSYLLFFQGAYVSSHMNGKQIFRTLSAGIQVYRNRGWICRRNGISGRYFKSLQKRNRKVAANVQTMLFGRFIFWNGFFHRKLLQVLVAGTMAGIMFSMIAIEMVLSEQWNVHAIWNIVMIGGGLAIGQKADQFSVMTYVLDAKSFAVTRELAYRSVCYFADGVHHSYWVRFFREIKNKCAGPNI